MGGRTHETHDSGKFIYQHMPLNLPVARNLNVTASLLHAEICVVMLACSLVIQVIQNEEAQKALTIFLDKILACSILFPSVYP